MNTQANILVVDDDQENLKVVSGLLQEQGLEIALAMDGIKALEILEENPIDLVLLDIIMPEMDGFEVCRHIKSNPETKEIPVIFLSSKTDTEDLVKGFEIGGADYVTKPFRKEELLARISNQLQIRKLTGILKNELQNLTRSRNLFIKTLYDFGHIIQSNQERGKQ